MMELDEKKIKEDLALFQNKTNEQLIMYALAAVLTILMFTASVKGAMSHFVALRRELLNRFIQ